MISLLSTFAGFSAVIILTEWVCWLLFKRKMEQMRFPAGNDPEGAYDYYEKRLRIVCIGHAGALITFSIIFCGSIWW